MSFQARGVPSDRRPIWVVGVQGGMGKVGEIFKRCASQLLTNLQWIQRPEDIMLSDCMDRKLAGIGIHHDQSNRKRRE